MQSEFPHLVRLKGHKVSAIMWCRAHVPHSEWEFWFEHDPDPDCDWENSVYAFRDDHIAMQFALMFT